jgi:hypothetical protein
MGKEGKLMGRLGITIGLSAAGLALGVVFATPAGAQNQRAAEPPRTTVRVSFGAGVDIPASAGGDPVLLQKEKADVDGDGTTDLVSYFDTDDDGAVDSEVIDLGSTGKPTILAIRCDADADGRYDDWLVVDAVSEEPRAALIDANDDGDVDKVAFADGSSEPVQNGSADLFRPVANY